MGLPLVDRSVRFRHTSAKQHGLRASTVDSAAISHDNSASISFFLCLGGLRFLGD
jgi:hypothetical protein